MSRPARSTKHVDKAASIFETMMTMKDREGSVQEQVIEVTGVDDTTESKIPLHVMNLVVDQSFNDVGEMDGFLLEMKPDDYMPQKDVSYSTFESLEEFNMQEKRKLEPAENDWLDRNEEHSGKQMEKRPHILVNVKNIDPPASIFSTRKSVESLEQRDHMTQGQSISVASEPLITVTVSVANVPGQTTTLQGSRVDVIQQLQKTLFAEKPEPTTPTTQRGELREEELEDMLSEEEEDDEPGGEETDAMINCDRPLRHKQDLLLTEIKMAEEQEDLFHANGDTEEDRTMEDIEELKKHFIGLMKEQVLKASEQEQIKDIEMTLVKERTGIG